MLPNTTKRVRNPFQNQAQPKPGTGPVNENPNFKNGLKALNPQQQLFVAEYIARNYDSFAASEAAGFKGAYGRQLRQLPNVQNAIRREIDARRGRARITQDRVLAEIALVAFGNVTDFFEDFGGGRTLNIKNKAALTPEQQRLMASISETWRGNNRTLKFSAHDKMKALTLLSQYMGLLDGTGRQIDPAGMAQRLRDAAAKAKGTMPLPTDGAEYAEYEDQEEAK